MLFARTCFALCNLSIILAVKRIADGRRTLVGMRRWLSFHQRSFPPLAYNRKSNEIRHVKIECRCDTRCVLLYSDVSSALGHVSFAEGKRTRSARTDDFGL